MEKFRNTPPPVGEARVAPRGVDTTESLTTVEEIESAEKGLRIQLEELSKKKEALTEVNVSKLESDEAIIAKYKEIEHMYLKAQVKALAIVTGGFGLLAGSLVGGKMLDEHANKLENMVDWSSNLNLGEDIMNYGGSAGGAIFALGLAKMIVDKFKRSRI